MSDDPDRDEQQQEIPTVTPEVREALYELQRYLSDSVAPLMVADSIEFLFRVPVQLTAAQIHAWATSQYRGPATNVPLSDFLFHAMKKIHVMGEYDLVSRENLSRFLQELARFVIAYCPPEDRDLLRVSLTRLGEATTTVVASSVEYIHRQAGSGTQSLASAPLASSPVTSVPGVVLPAGSMPLTPEIAQGLRGFGLLLQRLERRGPGTSDASIEGTPAADESPEIMSQLLTMAAVNSRTESELEHHLGRLRSVGLGSDTRDLFRTLGRNLPDWTLTAGIGGEPFGAAPLGSVEAMRNLISLAEDPGEGANRFREMVQAAIEQFNEGSLGRAATMFDLAERIIVEKKVDFTIVQVVRQRTGEGLDPDMLRRFAESPEKHVQLRKVLNFFTPLTPHGLLEDLAVEEKRDKRRLALALLEAHGSAARAAAIESLEKIVADREIDPNGFFARNLLYLLRRIPAPAGTDLAEEVRAIAGFVSLDAPSFLLKEVIAYLGQARHELGEKPLIGLLDEVERNLLKPKESLYDPQEQRQLLDRVVSALARLGSTNSIRAVVAHALKRQPALGDTMARLVDLGSQDLSSDPETVERLLRTLKNELPMRVLGFVVKGSANEAMYALKALAGTPAPSVRSALEDIVKRYADDDFGRTAAELLTGFGAQTKTPEAQAAPGLSGDLELFGLPSLLQTLADSMVSGMLTLKTPDGDTTGVLVMEKGKLLDAQAGKLRGAEAVYQLFERPEPGSFAFVSRKDSALDKERAATAMEIVPLLFESMRRYDEFRQSRAIVPDHVSFEVTGIRPLPHPEEKDGALSRMIWNKARTGATATDCETDVPADSYRVRRLLVHWVEHGALQPV